ncbi:MAG: DUF1810 domain-containing protein [Oscillospiraceae bacterium]|nr:DUF1810 domain-containing protein [Oscillospiraceae bacterium]
MMEKDLGRFLTAQENIYEKVLLEINNSVKKNYCLWYIFPQLEGLGYSPAAEHYGICGLSEARDYLAHEILGARLIELTEALLNLDLNDTTDIFGNPDNDKFLASMTLFHMADESNPVFIKAIDKFFNGKPDKKTLELLGK